MPTVTLWTYIMGGEQEPGDWAKDWGDLFFDQGICCLRWKETQQASASLPDHEWISYSPVRIANVDGLWHDVTGVHPGTPPAPLSQNGFDRARRGKDSEAMFLQLTDLEHFGQTALQEFGREVCVANPMGDEMLERQAQRLEAKLEQLYAVAATLARSEESLESVASVWARMVSICEAMAKALSDLQAGRPARLAAYDRILDIRNACEENRALHA